MMLRDVNFLGIAGYDYEKIPTPVSRIEHDSRTEEVVFYQGI